MAPPRQKFNSLGRERVPDGGSRWLPWWPQRPGTHHLPSCTADLGWWLPCSGVPRGTAHMLGLWPLHPPSRTSAQGSGGVGKDGEPALPLARTLSGSPPCTPAPGQRSVTGHSPLPRGSGTRLCAVGSVFSRNTGAPPPWVVCTHAVRGFSPYL